MCTRELGQGSSGDSELVGKLARPVQATTASNSNTPHRRCAGALLLEANDTRGHADTVGFLIVPAHRRDAWVRSIERIQILGLVIGLTFWGAGVLGDDDTVITACMTHCPPLLLVAPALGGVCLALVVRAWRAVAIGLGTTWLTVFPLGGCALGWPRASAAPELSIATYNVEQWTHSGTSVGQVLARARPDVFCLQEAGNYPWVPRMAEQLVDFERELAGYEVVRADEIAIGTRLPILGRNVVPLPLGLQSRPILEVVVEAFAKTPVSVISLHLVYTGHFARSFAGLGAAARARRAQAEHVVAYARSLARPVILCGDFNADFRSAAIEHFETEFRDAWQARGFGFGFTLPAGFLSRRIDYVFARDLEIARAQVLSATSSDHVPLWSVFTPAP